MHFASTSSSWLNRIERWFRELTEKCLLREVFLSKPERIATITAYAARHNAESKGFVWTKGAAQILEKVSRARAVLDKTLSA